ncbi:MAG: ATP-binding cassette domain-containing protein, partial [Actinobacteria bacterium]|nr:ATP-binding cassette domain-containing protein [Actinomycetota bacterium]
VGLAQVLGAGELWLPTAFAKLRPLTFFHSPFTGKFNLYPFVFHGDDIIAIGVVPMVVAGLAWFMTRSDTGTAVRAAADSNERALLLGIPVRRLSRVTWMIAAGLSGIGSMLSAPILGPHLGVLAGPTALLAPLAAAVIGRLESLPVTVAASLGIGVFEQVVFWNYPRSSTVDVGLFVVILAALLLQRRRVGRSDDSGLGGYVAVREVRPIPAVLRSLPEVRWARVGGWVALALLTLVVPLGLSHARLVEVAYIAIYGMLAVSLVVLTGWSGQVSLGQFAFAGVGAATTASLLVHAHADLFLCLIASALTGAFTALLVGFPAVRIRGLFLAVATLAFAVPVSTYLLNSAYFPTLAPHQLVRPIFIKRFDLDSLRVFYYFCLAFLAVTLLVARNLRHSRAGRAVLAVRENERGAASFSIDPTRSKLAAFAISGGIAGVAGGLYAVGLRGIPFSGFDPVISLQIFTMVVVGGLGSIGGAVLGAAYYEGAQAFLHGATQLLATGAGLLFLLMVVPGGLAEVLYGLRDRALRMLARRKDLSVPSLQETADVEETQERAAPVHATLDAPMLTCEDIDAGYGQIQVLFGVDLDVAEGEIVALLGTNGAGKSTVLKVIAGLMGPTPGRLAMGGTDLAKLSPADRVKAGVVLVPGGRGVFPSLTVAENLRLAGWLARKDKEFLDSAMARAFELFPVLQERLDSKASLLSGGEQQMLTIAQALLCRPKLLMIDELSLGLAPIVVATLLDVVKRINADGTTVVVVEQSVNVATSIAERAVFMERGQVRFSGPTKQLEKRPDLLRSVFLRSGTRTRTVAKRAASGNGSGEAALRIDGVSKRFGGVTAVNEVALDVPSGHILGVIGSNGAGKTTLFDIASGFLPPDSGRLFLHGRDVTELGAPGLAELGLGRSFQDARLFPSMTVAETLATALERHLEARDPFACMLHLGAVVETEREVAARVEELLELMNLAGTATRSSRSCRPVPGASWS